MIKGYSRWDNIRENYGFTGCHLIEDDIVNFHVENELEGGCLTPLVKISDKDELFKTNRILATWNENFQYHKATYDIISAAPTYIHTCIHAYMH